MRYVILALDGLIESPPAGESGPDARPKSQAATAPRVGNAEAKPSAASHAGGASTSLQRAATPTLDRLAQRGRLGTADFNSHTAPRGRGQSQGQGFVSATGLTPRRPAPPANLPEAMLTLFGLRADASVPAPAYGVLEALAHGIDAPAQATCLLAEGVNAYEDRFQLALPAALSANESAMLWEVVQPILEADLGLCVHPLAGALPGRAVLVDEQGGPWQSLDLPQPPAMEGRPLLGHRPGGDFGKRLIDALTRCHHALRDHDLNAVRVDLGQPPVTHLWCWGQGRIGPGPAFLAHHGVGAWLATQNSVVAGLSAWCGVQPWMDGVEAFLQHPDTDGGLLIVHDDRACLDDHHAADIGEAEALWADADRRWVAPLVDAIEAGEARLAVTATRCFDPAHRTPTPDPVPVLLVGDRLGGIVHRPFTEANAADAELAIRAGGEFMEFFLHAGLRRG